MMFSFISKVVDYFIGDSTQSPSHSKPSPGPADSAPSSLSSNSKTSVNDVSFNVPFLITKAENAKTRSFQGKVTHFFHGHGLIDGEVYFTASDVQRQKLQVGDNVDVKAVQHNEDGGWYAEHIAAIENMWDTGEKELEEEKEIDLDVLQSAVVIGMVTAFTNGRGRIEKEIYFEIDDCLEEYSPIRGDWVTANVEEHMDKAATDNDDEWNTSGPKKIRIGRDVAPARQRNIEASVTAVLPNHGYVEGNIFFNKDSCLNGYKPRKNDPVKVLAIESKQGKCEWRAISLVPLSSESNAYRSKQFQQPSKSAGATSSWLVPGQRPKSFQPKVMLPIKLPHFTVPENLEISVLEGEELTDTAPHLMQELTFVNYVRRMSTLLYLEEIQMQMDIREFDMSRVCLHPAREFLALTVPGLAEGRPSVLIGDKIILSSPSDPDGPSYEGFVHEMTCSDVHLKFNPDFHSRYNGEDYNVEFTFSRTPLRRCHQAVSLAVQLLGSKVLFPNNVELKPPQVKLESVMPLEDVIYLPTTYIESNHSSNATNNSNARTGQQQLLQQQYNGQTNKEANAPSNASSQDVRNSTSMLPKKSSSASSLSSFSQQQRNQQHSNQNNSNYHPQTTNGSGGAIFTPILQSQGLQYFNLRLNERQKAAVMKIVLGQARPMPYIIFGPPGTGKTITVVESILQVLSQIPSSRILACTPSNSAADLIAERLHLSGAVEQTQMVRLNAFNRSLDSIPESILRYCRFAEDLQMISRYRVIVSTCSMAGCLFGLGLSAGHVTHAFIDECGQATEPECLIPIGLISGADGQIVLAGDPKQLGPIIMSPFAKMYGLELSFLERLMLRGPYQRNEEVFSEHGGFDSALVTMLVNNYRSHPSILDLPSRLFYYNQLRPFADPELTHTLTKWDLLPMSGFPVIFHGIRGEDIREENSPSWFNPGETVQVVRYLQGVLKEGVDPDDIGIITPYRKQVEKIRLMIDRLSIPEVKVGSVEEFQGQERQVIIISTVRSNERLVGFDIRHTLGFLSNPKRFNVSITRAQALLILVGNPFVLAQDPNWRTLIQYCADNGGYTGCDLPDFSALEDKGGEMYSQYY